MKKLSLFAIALSAMLASCAGPSINSNSSSSDISGASSREATSQEPQVDVDATREILENEGYEATWATMDQVPEGFYTETERVRGGLSCHKSDGFFFAFFCYSIEDARLFMKANHGAFSSESPGVSSGLQYNVAWVGMRETAISLGWLS